jgi:hypothetical protein
MVLGRTLRRGVKAKSKFTLKKKATSMRKTVKRYLSKKDHIDFGDIPEVLRHFKLFFKAVIDIDDEEYSDEQRAKYDMKKDRILDKLDNIERNDPILRRIKNISPEIYTKLGYNSTNIPYLELIDVYYNILKKLETLLNEDQSSNVSVIQSLMLDDLVNAFIKKKNSKNISSIDDDLLDMFRGMSVNSDLDQLENMFKGMKVEF